MGDLERAHPRKVTSPDREGSDGEGLTRIRPGIHCATTPTHGGSEVLDDADQAEIEVFLSTLADIVQAIARREKDLGP